MMQVEVHGSVAGSSLVTEKEKNALLDPVNVVIAMFNQKVSTVAGALGSNLAGALGNGGVNGIQKGIEKWLRDSVC